jgi:phosphatidylserine decarboxylase
MNIIALIFIIILCVIIVFMLFWKLIFLRNPERIIAKGNNIVSPADGKIIGIIEFDGKNEVKFFKGNKRYLGIIKTLTGDVSTNGYIVSIFMNPLNVHYNRAPIAGKVLSVKYSDGRLLAVNTVEAGLVNEKTETIIEGRIKIKVIQIAGFIARRIETFVKKDEYVSKGQVFGLINLGSQVTLIMPKNVDIKIKKGEKVMAGETIIAKLKGKLDD